MQEQIQDNITYSDGELPIPTFHCRCGHSTEGFSLCLKCHPQTYTVREDLANKLQGVDIEKFAAREQNVYGREIWNAAIERAAKIVDQCNREGPYEAIMAARRIRELKK